MQLICGANEEDVLFRVGNAYETSSGWCKRSPRIDYGDMWNPPIPGKFDAAGIDFQWVMDMAKLSWLSYVDENIAKLMANHISPVKAVLAEAREYIKQHVQENPWHPYIP
jgi:hypothetical protein